MKSNKNKMIIQSLEPSQKLPMFDLDDKKIHKKEFSVAV
jgi:hypothetical protein